MKTTCSVKGCGSKEIAAKGMCWKHYRRWKRYGSVTLPARGGQFCTPGTVALHQRGTLRVAEDLIPKHLRGKDLQVEVIPDLAGKRLGLRFIEAGNVHSTYLTSPDSHSVFVVARKALGKLEVPWPAKGEKMREYKARKTGPDVISVNFNQEPK